MLSMLNEPNYYDITFVANPLFIYTEKVTGMGKLLGHRA